jgi:hypothetical protein
MFDRQQPTASSERRGKGGQGKAKKQGMEREGEKSRERGEKGGWDEGRSDERRVKGKEGGRGAGAPSAGQAWCGRSAGWPGPTAGPARRGGRGKARGG